MFEYPFVNRLNKWLVSTVILTSLTPGFVSAQSPQTVVMQKQGTTFSIDGNRLSDGAGQQVYLWNTINGNVNQKWVEIPRRGKDLFSYQKIDTNLCLDGGDGGARRQPITLESCDASNYNQRWRKISTGGNSYRLQKSNASDFSIDGNHNAKREQGIYLWNSDNENINQQWEFHALTDAPQTPVEPSEPVDTSDPEAITGAVLPIDLFNAPSEQEAAQFLLSASFGPTQNSIDELVDLGYSDWFNSQLDEPINLIAPTLNPNLADKTNYKWEGFARHAWYNRTIFGEDQLRQRAAFALSQIFVVSTEPRDWLFKSHLQGRYMDIMQEGAFGNFRDLMEDVTYSPLMGLWLTYIGSEKANPDTGSMPDENYAREIMQLFTIGLVELENNGQPVLDQSGLPIETYTIDDVSGLSKVFTGLWWADKSFGSGFTREAQENIDIQRMTMHDNFHSPEAKSFLGHTIPAGTNGHESIRQALDVLFEHQNVGPFIGKQLIQRMTTSNPTNAYVERVAQAFNSGRYTLPNGERVGTGERGDMPPVFAAILLDEEARNPNRFNISGWGKVREPLIRLIHWARASNIASAKVTSTPALERGAPTNTIGQDAFRSRSVFNFFRPGFVAGGTYTASAGIVAPELQITTSATAMHYPNLMQEFVFDDSGRHWVGRYSDQIPLASNPSALTEHLNVTMTGGRMTDRTRARVLETIESVSNLRDRVQLGMYLVVNSQEYNTQQ